MFHGSGRLVVTSSAKRGLREALGPGEVVVRGGGVVDLAPEGALHCLSLLGAVGRDGLAVHPQGGSEEGGAGPQQRCNERAARLQITRHEADPKEGLTDVP